MRTFTVRMMPYAFYAHTAIREQLEAMAAKGWMIDKLGNLFWRYKRMEPRRLRFAVSYFPTASEFDPALTEGQLQLADYCEHDGWRFAAQWRQMQIFCTDDANARPIETDAAMQVQTIERAMGRGMLPIFWLLAAAALISFGCTPVRHFLTPSAFATQAQFYVTLLADGMFLTATLMQLIQYLQWRRSALKQAQNGVFSECRHNRRSGMVLVMGATLLYMIAHGSAASLPKQLLGLLLLLPLVLLADVLFMAVKGGLRRRQVSRGVNRAVTIAVFLLGTLALSLALTWLMIA